MPEQRRRRDAAFELECRAALEEAELALEFRLATIGNDRCSADGEAPARDSADADAAPPDRFDPDIALRFLKLREAKRHGRPAGGRWRRPRTLDEVGGSILRKLEAIKQHHDSEQLAENWSRDEATDVMIPPGRVRADPSAREEDGAGS